MSDPAAQLEIHRTALTGHCYRMLGSSTDADDAAQETLIRAWKNLEKFDGRASLRTWLYRIATNVCLDELADRNRRVRPMEERPAGLPSPEGLTQMPRTHWIEPVAEARAIPAGEDPSQRVMLRQSIRLAFVAALQRLAPKQRAALLLTEVLGWSAAEVAETLETTVAAVNSALQRARAALAAHGSSNNDGDSGELTGAQARMLDRYVEAFERYDVDALASLLREDATFSMPPFELWLQGPENIRTWLLGPGGGCRGSRLLPVAASGSPAFAQYRAHSATGGHTPWALVVLELSGDRIAGWNSFLDVETLFPKFGLPMYLPPR